MGFSPGQFLSGAYPEEELHWEGGSRWITLWNKGESKALVCLTYEEARKASDQLSLLVDMAEEDGL